MGARNELEHNGPVAGDLLTVTSESRLLWGADGVGASLSALKPLAKATWARHSRFAKRINGLYERFKAQGRLPRALGHTAQSFPFPILWGELMVTLKPKGALGGYLPRPRAGLPAKRCAGAAMGSMRLGSGRARGTTASRGS